MKLLTNEAVMTSDFQSEGRRTDWLGGGLHWMDVSKVFLAESGVEFCLNDIAVPLGIRCIAL